MRKVLLIFSLSLITISGFGQYKSLIESPLYIKGKRNFYQDTVPKLIMPIEHLDSLYKEKRNRPFHVFEQITKSDSVIWEIAFFDAGSTGIRLNGLEAFSSVGKCFMRCGMHANIINEVYETITHKYLSYAPGSRHQR